MPPRITLKQLQYFLAVAKHGSIALAAAELHSAPPTVSTAIKTLETVLNVDLFLRHHARGVSLTPAGKRLLQRAERLLADAADLEQQAKSEAEEPAGDLRIGCYPTLAPLIMPALMAATRSRFPKINLSFVEGPETRLFTLLDASEIDLVLCYSDCLPGHFLKTFLHRTKPYCLLPAAHPLATQDRVSLPELADYPMVLLDTEPAREQFLGLFDTASLRPDIVQRTASFEVLRGLVGHGIGYALLVTRPHSNHTYDGTKVVQRPLGGDIAASEICMVRVPTPRLPKRSKAILELSKEICAQVYGSQS